jgi:NADH-quinone oxidoreductase subunit N
MALIYGKTTTTSIDVINANFSTLSGDLLFLAGILLFLIGFSFKIAAFPFHMWVPDVYQGAPTTITALFSTTGKAAGFSALIVTLSAIFAGPNSQLFTPYLSAIAVFSMLFGSIVAIMQTDIKRMLAYSSIAHAGYMLIGLAAGNTDGISGIIFYLAAYTFMNLAAFGIVSIIEGKDETRLDIDTYAGLGNRRPFIAGLLALIMFALAGIPPFAGFFGKYYVFIAAIKSNLTWLAIVGVVSSVISVYFYLRIVVIMYFKTAGTDEKPSYLKLEMIGVIISVALVIILGLLPGSLINLITSFLY